MKKLVVLTTGFSPLLLGYVMNSFVNNSNSTHLDILLDFISIVFFLYWGGLGFVLCRFTKKKASTLIISNLPAAIVLIFILIQELINKAYWNNHWGSVTQIFYLPTLRFSDKVTPDFMHFMWQTYIVSFAIMIFVFFVGCYVECYINDKVIKLKKPKLL